MTPRINQSDKPRRQCGDCTLCCTLVPVKEIEKKANTKCAMQTFKGCRVYGTKRMPWGCQVWNCRWLVRDDTDDQARPDRSHLVIDMMPDFVTMNDDLNGIKVNVPVVQVWIDPKHPDAHKDYDFRNYVSRRGEEGYGVLVRNGNDSATFLLAPTFFNGDPRAQWVEKVSNLKPESQHSQAEIAKVIGGVEVIHLQSGDAGGT